MLTSFLFSLHKSTASNVHVSPSFRIILCSQALFYPPFFTLSWSWLARRMQGAVLMLDGLVSLGQCHNRLRALLTRLLVLRWKVRWWGFCPGDEPMYYGLPLVWNLPLRQSHQRWTCQECSLWSMDHKTPVTMIWTDPEGLFYQAFTLIQLSNCRLEEVTWQAPCQITGHN